MVGGATVAYARRPLPRKAAAIADIIFCRWLTHTGYSHRRRVASVGAATFLLGMTRFGSLCLDPELLDDRPPFLDLGLLNSTERRWRLLSERRDVLSQGERHSSGEFGTSTFLGGT